MNPLRFFRRLYVSVRFIVLIVILWIVCVKRDSFRLSRDVITCTDKEAGAAALSLNMSKSGYDVTTFRKQRYDHYQHTQKSRSGLGEQGKPVHLSTEDHKMAESQLSTTGGSFKVVSDMISLDRALVDGRSEQCRQVLPTRDAHLTVSVIVTFCNDSPSLVLRTAHSVVNRSPPQYLREVILVDDNSDHEELKEQFEEEVEVTWPDGIVRILRSHRRRGVVGARMFGINSAVGDIIVSLDGHTEVLPGWLEPIVSRLEENPHALVCPILISIDAITFEVSSSSQIWPFKIDFTWSMTNRLIVLAPDKDPIQATKPIRTYSSSGGAWAMIRKTFLRLGGYDTGNSAWGGEDWEFALRVWLCEDKGVIEMLPCSLVGHVYRKGKPPYPWVNETDTEYTQKNFQRTAEVWMDEYKPIFYKLNPHLKHKNFGDISTMMNTRKTLGCRNFHWFLTNIATHKVFPDLQAMTVGQVENAGDHRYLDVVNGGEGKPIGLYHYESEAYRSQYFVFDGRLMWKIEFCLDYTQSESGFRPILKQCGADKKERWIYKDDTKQLIHQRTSMCLDSTDRHHKADDPFDYVTLNTCSEEASQQWIWHRVDV